jgi:hypothetical protein
MTSWFADFQDFYWIAFGHGLSIVLAAMINFSIFIGVIRVILVALSIIKRGGD